MAWRVLCQRKYSRTATEAGCGRPDCRHSYWAQTITVKHTVPRHQIAVDSVSVMLKRSCCWSQGHSTVETEREFIAKLKEKDRHFLIAHHTSQHRKLRIPGQRNVRKQVIDSQPKESSTIYQHTGARWLCTLRTVAPFPTPRRSHLDLVVLRCRRLPRVSRDICRTERSFYVRKARRAQLHACSSLQSHWRYGPRASNLAWHMPRKLPMFSKSTIE